MMGLAESLRELLSRPLSSQDLSDLLHAAKKTRKDYPSWKSLEETQKVYNSLLKENQEWGDCATKVGQLLHSAEDSITSSRRDFAKGGDISVADVNAYLELLRDSGTHVSLMKVTPHDEFNSCVNGIDHKKTWVVPVQVETGWAFAVVYPHCTHWYDSNQVASGTEGSSVWSGPLSSDTTDTGVIMLLGIRLIAKGLTHVTTEVIQDRLSHFRTRLLVELICEQLDPNTLRVSAAEGKVTALLQREQQLESSYFNDALGYVSWESHELPLNASFQVVEAQTGCDKQVTNDSRADNPSLEARDHALLSIAQGSQDEVNPSRRLRSSRRDPVWPTLLQKPPDDFKSILEVLSDATAAARCIGASHETEMPALCSIIENKSAAGYFHRRYCKTLLYNKVLNGVTQGNELHAKDLAEFRWYTGQIRGSSVEDPELDGLMQECQLWMNLRYWCASKNIYEPALLCAIPKGQALSVCTLEQLQNRLYDQHDVLCHLLKDAEELCRAILCGNLPSYVLCVEVYPSKQQQDFDRDTFTAFVSVKRNPLIPLPRAPPSSYSRIRKPKSTRRSVRPRNIQVHTNQAIRETGISA